MIAGSILSWYKTNSLVNKANVMPWVKVLVIVAGAVFRYGKGM